MPILFLRRGNGRRMKGREIRKFWEWWGKWFTVYVYVQFRMLWLWRIFIILLAAYTRQSGRAMAWTDDGRVCCPQRKKWWLSTDLEWYYGSTERDVTSRSFEPPSFFRFCIKNEHACILLSLAGIELGDGDRVLVNISDLERSQQETVVFSLKENQTFISSARLSHIWDKWPRKSD